MAEFDPKVQLPGKIKERPSLSSFRRLHPEFNDISDDDLARAIYKTHFPEYSFEDFSDVIGYKPPQIQEDPSLFERGYTGLKKVGGALYDIDKAVGGGTYAPSPKEFATSAYQGLKGIGGKLYDIDKAAQGYSLRDLPGDVWNFLKQAGGELYKADVALGAQKPPALEEVYSGAEQARQLGLAEEVQQPLTWGDKLAHSAMRFMRGTGRTGTSMGKFIGAAGYVLDSILPEALRTYKYDEKIFGAITDPTLRKAMKRDADARDTWFYGTFQKLEDDLNKATEGDPRLKDDFLYSVLPDAAGNMTAFMIASLLTGGGKVPVAIMGMMLEGQGAYDEALRETGDPDLAWKNLMMSAPAGLLEVFGVSRVVEGILRPLPANQKRAFLKLLVEAVKTGAVEGAEEIAQGGWENLVKKYLYNADQDILEGLGTASGAAGIVGTVAHLLAGAAGMKLRGGKLFTKEGVEVLPGAPVSPTGEVAPEMKLEEGLKKVRAAEEEIPEEQRAYRELQEIWYGKQPLGEYERAVTPSEEPITKRKKKEEAPAKIEETPTIKELEKLAEEAARHVEVPTKKEGIREGERRFASHETPTPREGMQLSVEEATSFRGERKTTLLGPTDNMIVAKNARGEDVGYLWYTREPEGGFTVRKIETIGRGTGAGRTLYRAAFEKEGPYRGSTDRTLQGTAFFNRLKETDPDIFREFLEKRSKEEVKRPEKKVRVPLPVAKEEIPAKIARSPKIVAAILHKEKIYAGKPGQTHGQLYGELPESVKPYEMKTGFVEVGTDKYLTRSEALKLIEPEAEGPGVTVEELQEREARTTMEPAESAELIRESQKSRYRQYLTPHTEESLKGAQVFMNKDRSIGYAIQPDGEIVNLFNRSGIRGAGKEVLQDAIERGGTWGTAFDGYLVKMYKSLGAEEFDRKPFNETYAPPGWDVKEDGKPDVVWLRFPKKLAGIGLPGETVSKPHKTYGEAEQNTSKSKNLWIRLSDAPTNKGRTLLVQFSSLMLPGGEKLASQYYDRLYSETRDGYVRATDFWEIPEWIGVAANSLSNSDVYIVRNVKKAITFLKEAGYDTVAFSALDVNKSLIQEVAKGYDGEIAVGGYGSLKEFKGIRNVTTHGSMDEFIRARGQEVNKGVNYRHFKGTEVIPRLVLSEGCLHKCAFCDVQPHGKVVEKSSEDIESQVHAIKDLKAKLVYINDKTFGQAKNYRKLPQIFKSFKSSNPSFKGFIVQTTASAMKKLDPAWMKEAGVQYVELGVESYNDEILRKFKKPATTATIDAAVQKIREAGLKFIPNIIIGSEGETAQTYANTAQFLDRNSDVISHVNAYNLAVYEGTDFAETLGADLASDVDENALEKSWHKDEAEKKVHRDFATWLYNWSTNRLNQPVGGRPGAKGAQLGEKLFATIEPFAPEKVTHVSVEEAVERGQLTEDEGNYITGVLEQFPESWREHLDVRISEQEFAPSEAQLKAYGYEKGAGGLVVKGVLLTERMKDVKTDAKHLAVLFKGSDISTFVHELAEFVYKRALGQKERSLVKKLNQTKTADNEWFSDQFEKWWFQSKPTDSRLMKIFRRILKSIQGIYRRLSGAEVNLPIADLINDVITSGKDINERYYYSDEEIVRNYVLGTEASPWAVKHQGLMDNQKTGMSWEPSTQCPKQEAWTKWILDVGLDRYGLSLGDLAHVQVLAELYDAALADGVDVPCSYCYVEKRRRMAIEAHEKGWTRRGIGFTKAKSVWQVIPYKDAILKLSDTEVKELNKRGGVRIFSFADYIRAYHKAEVDQFLRHCEERGLSVKAITKSLDFVEDFADTGITINLSIDLDPKGRFGVHWDKAAAAQKKYPNVKVRGVFGTIPELVQFAGMKNPTVDVLTPYHHEDPNQPLPEGWVDMAHGTRGGKDLVDFLDKKRPDLKKRVCCLVGGKCFSLAHNKRCAANCGLLAGNLSVPKSPTLKEVAAKLGPAEDSGTLIEWIRRMGGVWDPSLVEETREFHPTESGVLGLVRKGGRPWNSLVDDAINDGWLPDEATGGDLRGLLRQDIIGQKHGLPRPIRTHGQMIEDRLDQDIASEAERHYQALEEGADEAFSSGLAYLGKDGDIPASIGSMVEDLLHTKGIRDRIGKGTVSKKDLNRFWKYIQLPDSIRRIFREFDPVFQVQYARQLKKERLDRAFAEMTDPYFSLDKQERVAVDEVLLEGERRRVPILSRQVLEDEFGLSEKEIAGYKAIRVALNNARNMLLQIMKEHGVKDEVIAEFEHQARGYVPHKWYGKYAIVAKDAKGKTVYMSATDFSDRYTERDAVQQMFPGTDVQVIKRTDIPYEAFQEAPAYAVQQMVDLALEKTKLSEKQKKELNQALTDLYKSKGFGMHFIQRKGIPGYTEDLGRPLAEYFVGFSGYLTKLEAMKQFPTAMAGIHPQRQGNLYKYTLDYINYVTGDQFEFQTAKMFMYTYYLWGNIKSASLNLTQNLVLGWPVLSGHTKWALPKMLQAMGRTASGMLTTGEREFLAELEKGGFLDPKLSQEISGHIGSPIFKKLRSKTGKTFSLLDVFRHAEQFNRQAMAVALYDAGIRDVAAAAELINEAHFHYAKGNRPHIARGPIGSPVMTFRSWHLNYLTYLRRMVREGKYGQLSRSLVALMLFGGFGALPFWDELKKLFTEYLGIDPETKAREIFGKRWGRDLIHGIPAELGVEFSGSVGMADILPKSLQDIGGVFMDFIPGMKGSRVSKVTKSLRAGDWLRALEDASPEALKNVLAGRRLHQKGATTRSGRPVLDLRTGKQLRLDKKDLYKKTLGFYPLKLAEEYVISETLQTIKGQRMELKTAWADRYRIAVLNKDTEARMKVMDELREYNRKMREKGRYEDQITPDEMKSMIRTRYMAVNRPPRYLRGKLRKLTEQY